MFITGYAHKNMKRFSYFFIIAALILVAFSSDCKVVLPSDCQKPMYYAVTFDPNGGRLFGEATIAVKPGEKVPPQEFIYPPENYSWTGWYKDAEGLDPWNFDTDVVTGNMTLYAGWEYYDTYTFTLHANGGTFFHDKGEVSTVTVRDGNTLDYPGNVIKPGYVLEGWYRDEALAEKWDFETDVPGADGALYAKWGKGIDGLTPENYPRVDGATSTRALNMMIGCKLLGLSYTWYWVSDDEMSVYPANAVGFLDSTTFDGRIKTSQTYGAMMNLIEGKADIILRSTTASPTEKAAAEAAGVTLVETPIALDAFVFFGNWENPVRSLTLKQVRGIMTQQITDWSQVGGQKATIDVYTRPRNSGSEEALRELVMQGVEPAEFPEEQMEQTMEGVFGEVSGNPGGISYIFKNYKDEIVGREDEPVFAIDGIAPNAVTIEDRSYPLTTEVYAIIRSDLDRNSMGYKLYEWLQTESAQTVLKECGFYRHAPHRTEIRTVAKSLPKHSQNPNSL
jgi:phosphate transport system substrate-binding protein